VLTQPLHRRLPAAWSGPIGLAAGAAGLALSLVAARLDAWPVLMPAAVLLGAGCLTMVARLTPPAERGALTGTFYACAYLGFGVPLLLSAVGGDAGLGSPLAGLAIVAAAVAVVLTLPPMRRLALSAAAPVHPGRAAR
jgi:hypothetical protein